MIVGFFPLEMLRPLEESTAGASGGKSTNSCVSTEDSFDQLAAKLLLLLAVKAPLVASNCSLRLSKSKFAGRGGGDGGHDDDRYKAGFALKSHDGGR